MIPFEIERKFLVIPGAWVATSVGTTMRQGYLAGTDTASIRVRVQGDEARLTIKARRPGPSREEFEYPIPVDHAEWMLSHLVVTPLVEKKRYLEMVGGMTWEVDVFSGQNAGLIMAEIELTDGDDPFERPSWAGEDVTHDARFSNFSLSRCPWPTWGPQAYPLHRGEVL